MCHDTHGNRVMDACKSLELAETALEIALAGGPAGGVSGVLRPSGSLVMKLLQVWRASAQTMAMLGPRHCMEQGMPGRARPGSTRVSMHLISPHRLARGPALRSLHSSYGHISKKWPGSGPRLPGARARRCTCSVCAGCRSDAGQLAVAGGRAEPRSVPGGRTLTLSPSLSGGPPPTNPRDSRFHRCTAVARLTHACLHRALAHCIRLCQFLTSGGAAGALARRDTPAAAAQQAFLGRKCRGPVAVPARPALPQHAWMDRGQPQAVATRLLCRSRASTVGGRPRKS